MNYEFKGTRGKWYLVSLDEFWTIRDGDFYNSIDIFNEEECPEAKQNAVLASMSPEMFEMLNKCLQYFEMQNEESKNTILLKEIKKLLKEATEL